jgi:hypothetical protein
MESRILTSLRWILAALFLFQIPLRADNDPKVPKHLLAVKNWKGVISISHRHSAKHSDALSKGEYKFSCKARMDVNLPLVEHDTGAGNDPFGWGTDDEAENPKSVGTGTSTVTVRENGSMEGMGTGSKNLTGSALEKLEVRLYLYPIGYELSMRTATKVMGEDIFNSTHPTLPSSRETIEDIFDCQAGSNSQPYPKQGSTLSGSFSYSDQDGIAGGGDGTTISWRLYPADKPDPGPEPPVPEPEPEKEPEPDPPIEDKAESCEDVKKRPDSEKSEYIDHITAWAERVLRDAQAMEKHFEIYVKDTEQMMEMLRQQLSDLEADAKKEDNPESMEEALQNLRNVVANAEKDLLKINEKLEKIKKLRQECENDAALAKEYQAKKSQDLDQAACDITDLSRRIDKHDTQLTGIS